MSCDDGAGCAQASAAKTGCVTLSPNVSPRRGCGLHGERNVSFGSELREERERQGIGLAAIAERTKVSERYLRALEDDAHEHLPGGIFNRGIVRGYCQQLDLNEDEWLQRFTTEFAAPGSEPDWDTFAENVRRNRESTGAARRRWWGVLLMFLALVALGWVAWHYVVKPRMVPLKSPEAPANVLVEPNAR